LSVATEPASPPSTATVPRHPTAPPTRRYLGEPRLRSSCPAPSPLSSGACAANLAASHPPVSRRRPRHCVGRVRDDHAHGARRANQRGPSGPFRLQDGPRQDAPPRPWAGKRMGRRAPCLWAATPEGHSHGPDFAPTLCGGFYFVFQLF
jgi:hypothetical protein